jgi:hypothetical protein
MAHHKRGRAKNQRAGCLLCKPHKMNGVKRRGLVLGGGSWRQERSGAMKLSEQALEHDEDIEWAELERLHGID